MPNFDFVKESTYDKSFRNESVKGQFDLSIETIKEHFKGSIDIENKENKKYIIVRTTGHLLRIILIEAGY